VRGESGEIHSEVGWRVVPPWAPPDGEWRSYVQRGALLALRSVCWLVEAQGGEVGGGDQVAVYIGAGVP